MRLLIVSNRLPVTGVMNNDEVVFGSSIGGLATGLGAFLKSHDSSYVTDCLWIGSPGLSVEREREEALKSTLLQKFKCLPVYLTEAMYSKYYIDFCNNCLWPLFHSMPTLVDENESWNAYEAANQFYFEALKEVIREGDIIWINDFHLMLLPEMLRKAYPRASVCFFLHIPFPPYEIFRILSKSWKEKILNGLLSSDLIGFHTNDYLQEFSKSVVKILGHEHKNGKFLINNRTVKMDSYPMSIDFKAFNESAADPALKIRSERLKEEFGDQKLILSVDRLDYTKGILNRLRAYEQFLNEHPEWHSKVSMILIVAPSRTEVDTYQEMKEQIDEQVGKINGYFSIDRWIPVIYQYKRKSVEELTVLYQIADIALITPLRDGMNLMAKEFVAARADEQGVLILSELAGASIELGAAKLVNPYHIHEIKSAILDCLHMSKEEQRTQLRTMRKRVKEYDIFKWSEELFRDLQQVRRENALFEQKEFTCASSDDFLKNYQASMKKLVLIDYDGTLVPFEQYPDLAFPSETVRKMLRELSLQPGLKLIILTGRSRDVVDKWFGNIAADFVAEHGALVKVNGMWTAVDLPPNDWKCVILPFLHRYVLRLPGSFIEEKEYSLVWHFRNSEIELSNSRQRDLAENLAEFLTRYSLELTSTVKSIELRRKGISKRNGLARILKHSYDFVACFGDDDSDEELFKYLPPSSFTFKVGYEPTNATFVVRNYMEVHRALELMIPAANDQQGESKFVA